MITAQVSDKGQVTLPAEIRRSLGIGPKSKVEIGVKGKEIVIRPVQSVREVRGIFRHAAGRVRDDWDTVRTEAERLVAEEVVGEER